MTPKPNERAVTVSDPVGPVSDGGDLEGVIDGAPVDDVIRGHEGVVRALNFTGGAFDAVMQFGVIHALLVMRGRAPDVVTGLSAGAVNAAALAEVMQAGSDENHATPEETRARRLARFQQILDELHRAPARLIDQLIPDAYQIDTNETLRVVETPGTLEPERRARQRAMLSRTGLARLYNHVLDQRVTFGTLARAVRRLLGISAAAEVRRPWIGRWNVGRSMVRAFELYRLWILIGSEMYRLAPLATRLSPIWFEVRRTGATAGTMIFRFRRLRGAGVALSHFVLYFAGLTVWVWITVSLVLFPHQLGRLLVAAAEWARLPSLDPNLVGYGLVAAFVGGVISLALPAVREFDGSDGYEIARLLVKGAWGTVSPVLVFALMVIPTAFVVLVWISAVGPGSSDPGWALDRLYALALWLDTGPVVWLQVPAVTVAVVAGWYTARRTPGGRYLRRILDRYHIGRSIFDPYPLEQVLSQAFDPTFHGTRNMDAVVDASLEDRAEPSQPTPVPDDDCHENGRKRIECYALRKPPIRLGIGTANLENGAFVVVPPETSVVDGLMAATAAVPLFPPKTIKQDVLVDGTRVTNEPMNAALEILRDTVDNDVERILAYSVTPLPASKARLPLRADPNGEEPILDLVRTVERAIELKRFQDATLDSKLTRVVNRALDGEVKMEKVRTPVASADRTGVSREQTFVRIESIPVEAERPIDLTRRILRARKDERRRLSEETIADGCRVAMQQFVGPSVRAQDGIEGRTQRIPCWDAVKLHLGDSAGATVGLPGSSREKGPGLNDICRHCVLSRANTELPEAVTDPRHLRIEWPGEGSVDAPAWPVEEPGWRPPPEESAQKGAGTSEESIPTEVDSRVDEGGERGTWPEPRVICGKPAPGPSRPLVNLVFSGGVFRGVFQLGVLNALSELGARPDVIAGASVGSITGAMAAEALRHESNADRRSQVAKLAAVYLALDRLVLTDRLADFVRTFTVRAAEARFSIRQADRVFRQFDAPGKGRFEKDARVVLAGLERLLYVSPFEVKRFVESVRERLGHEVTNQLRGHAQEWLDRMDVGDEILGAEPLELLIHEYVLSSVPWQETTFDSFLPYGIRLLATVTNLTKGRLEIIGEPPWDRPAGERGQRAVARLDQGLLASSAFPAVFRPRWSHEVFPGDTESDQYVDGGIMDNLPLDPVAHFLWNRSQDRPRPTVAARPRVEGKPVPHLVFAGSLQVSKRTLTKDGGKHGSESWPELRKRTRQLAYNQKVAKYQAAQWTIRAIYGDHENPDVPLPTNPLLDIEVVVVKPRWLCNTFGFHPMLGFRRRKQAESIAHGCASTFLEFARLDREPYAEGFMRGWGLAGLPRYTNFEDAFRHRVPEATDSWRSSMPFGKSRSDRCWLRPDVQCPFSAQALEDSGLPRVTREALSEIHRVCGLPETHAHPKVRAAKAPPSPEP